MIELKKKFFFNEEVNTYLKSIIRNKSFANGYIFYGAEGVGKKQTALQFIKEIFKQSSPVGNIDERITNNNHPDFLIIEPNYIFKIGIDFFIQEKIVIFNLNHLLLEKLFSKVSLI